METKNVSNQMSMVTFRVRVSFSIVVSQGIYGNFPGGSDGESVCLECGRPGSDPGVRKIPWRKKWYPTPVLLPGESNGWRSLVGYSPLGGKESDTTGQLYCSQGICPGVGLLGYMADLFLVF